MAPYKYKNLEVSIHKILKGNVTLSEEKKKECNEYLQEIFEILENIMKKDPVFSELFRQKQYVGSYYENMKIDVPDEFDIDYELWIPSYIGKLEVCQSEQPGFCQLKLHENTLPVTDTKKEDARKEVNKWTDNECFLSRCKVNRWMQSLIDKALKVYEEEYEQKMYTFNRSTSGPAVTLTVTLVEHPELRLSLDFVPVFVFYSWPNIENLRERTPEMVLEKWYAVPKSDRSDNDFRICFWHQENHLLRGTNQMKPVLKLVKKLRDIQQWKGISSYYIKTMFLWKTDANGKDYWKKGLGERFMEMLSELKEYLLEKKCLPFFWVEGNDLLAKVKPEEKTNIGQYLKNMIRDIEKNIDEPGYLEKYFKLRDGVQSYEEDSDDSVLLYQADSDDDSYLPYQANVDDTVNWNRPIAPSYRTVNRTAQLPARQQQDNTGAIVAGVAVGAIAIFTAGLFASLFNNNRRRQN